MIGDCKALYGNNTIDNELEIDIMYAKDVLKLLFVQMDIEKYLLL